MPIKFVAEKLPGGIPYASFQRGDLTVVVADPDVLRALSADPELTPLAYDMCSRVLSELEDWPGRRLRSVA